MESQNNSKVFGSIYTTRPKQDRHNQLLLPTSESHVKYENTHSPITLPEHLSSPRFLVGFVLLDL
jgi:hypothetical protein